MPNLETGDAVIISPMFEEKEFEDSETSGTGFPSHLPTLPDQQQHSHATEETVQMLKANLEAKENENIKLLARVKALEEKIFELDNMLVACRSDTKTETFFITPNRVLILQHRFFSI